VMTTALEILDIDGASYGVLTTRGAANEAIEALDPQSRFSVATGTAGSINVIADGDSTYTLQSLIGSRIFVIKALTK